MLVRSLRYLTVVKGIFAWFIKATNRMFGIVKCTQQVKEKPYLRSLLYLCSKKTKQLEIEPFAVLNKKKEKQTTIHKMGYIESKR